MVSRNSYTMELTLRQEYSYWLLDYSDGDKLKAKINFHSNLFSLISKFKVM
jgi:hypothetical protein